MLLSRGISIADAQIVLTAVRARGPGGQNVNKLASAIHLRFDIRASSLPAIYQQRLLQLNDQRISKQGIIIIKAQRHRSQDKNRTEALHRLQLLLQSVLHSRKVRRATKPTLGSRLKRLDKKTQHGKKKRLRSKPTFD